jgi:glycosyltransferase involved in cell wall biosynthesis
MSDVFILSSKHEGLPNSMLEAAYLNKYIISSNCNTGPKEILNEYRYGELYKVGNINHLYLKIAKLNKKKLINKKKNYSKNLMSFDFAINLRKYLKTIIKLI